VFDNRVQRRVFGLKRNEVNGGWRKLHNEEIYNFCSLSSIIAVIKLWKMMWAGQEV
jgi:hypothetical protein